MRAVTLTIASVHATTELVSEHKAGELPSRHQRSCPAHCAPDPLQTTRTSAGATEAAYVGQVELWVGTTIPGAVVRAHVQASDTTCSTAEDWPRRLKEEHGRRVVPPRRLELVEPAHPAVARVWVRTRAWPHTGALNERQADEIRPVAGCATQPQVGFRRPASDSTVVLLVAHQLQSQMSRCCEGPRRSRCRSSASAARSAGAVAPANRSPRAAGETEGTGTDHASNSSKPYLAY